VFRIIAEFGTRRRYAPWSMIKGIILNQSYDDEVSPGFAPIEHSPAGFTTSGMNRFHQHKTLHWLKKNIPYSK
jgi:hypothetical protein